MLGYDASEAIRFSASHVRVTRVHKGATARPRGRDGNGNGNETIRTLGELDCTGRGGEGSWWGVAGNGERATRERGRGYRNDFRHARELLRMLAFVRGHAVVLGLECRVCCANYLHPSLGGERTERTIGDDILKLNRVVLRGYQHINISTPCLLANPFSLSAAVRLLIIACSNLISSRLAHRLISSSDHHYQNS